MKFLKIPRQKKSRTYYYYFHVTYSFFGQLYVGYGYRLMHGSMLDLMNKVDGVLLHKTEQPKIFIENECKRVSNIGEEVSWTLIDEVSRDC